MTPWAWYWREAGEDDEPYGCEGPTREAAIADAAIWLDLGTRIDIVEARMSEAKAFEGSDWIPFLRARNHETLTVGGAA